MSEEGNVVKCVILSCDVIGWCVVIDGQEQEKS